MNSSTVRDSAGWGVFLHPANPGDTKGALQEAGNTYSGNATGDVSPSTLTAPGLGPGLQHQHPELGEVVDGVAHALAAQPRVLHAAVGHVVHAERRHVVVDHPADLEALEGPEGRGQIVGEDPACSP